MNKFRRIGFLVFVLALILSTSILSYADYSNNHVYSKTWEQSVSSLKYYNDSSVVSYGWDDMTSHAAAQWTAASSNVSITKTSSDPNYGIIAIYMGQMPDETKLGVAEHWRDYLTWFMVDPNKGNWDRVRIIIDNDNVENLGYDSYSDKLTIMTHEFGHAMALGHFDDSPSHSPTASIMYKNINNCVSKYLSSLDKDHFVYKFGD